MRLQDIRLELVNKPLLSEAGIIMPLAMLEGVGFAEKLEASQRGYRRSPRYSDGTIGTVMVILAMLGRPDFDAIEERRDHSLLREGLAGGVRRVRRGGSDGMRRETAERSVRPWGRRGLII